MAIYGQTLEVFKRKNNERSHNEDKTKLHKNIIVVFLIRYMWSMTHISSRITSLWRHNDVICDEIHVIASHMPNSKNNNFDFMQHCLFSVA